MDWEKASEKETSNKGLFLKIDRDLLKFNYKKMNSLI